MPSEHPTGEDGHRSHFGHNNESTSDRDLTCGHRDCCAWSLQGLSAEEHAHLMRAYPAIHLPPRQQVFRQGEPRLSAYIVCRGLVKVARCTADARVRIVKLVGQGELLAVTALFLDGPHMTYAETVTDAHIRYVRREWIEELLAARPELYPRFAAVMASEIEALQATLTESTLASSLEKFASTLIKLSQYCGVKRARGWEIDVRLQRNDLAELSGIAPETVSRLLADLKRRGLVTLEDGIIFLHDGEKLQKLAVSSHAPPIEGLM